MEMNRSQLAEHFNVALTTIDDWRRSGCPNTKKGRSVVFNVRQVEEWINEKQGGELDYTQERAKLTKLQAEKVSLELEQQRGSLIPMDLVVATWQGHIGNARAKLLALPPKIAGQVIAIDNYLEIEQLITGLVYEALDELEKDELSTEQRSSIKTIADNLEVAANANR